MAKKAELKAVLTMNDSQFLRGIKNAANVAKRFAAQLAANPIGTVGLTTIIATEKALLLAAKAAKVFAVAGGVAFVGIAAKAISAAASMERLNLTFESLLGTAKKADARMGELAKFKDGINAFGLDAVAKGNQNLQILTRGILTSERGMRLIGDTAAGLNKPFEELSETVGKLFAELSQGKSGSSEIAALEAIGAITKGGARSMESMTAGGTSKGSVQAWKVAEAELMRFSGKMKQQAQTWDGMWFAFRESAANAFRKIGAPLIKALKPSLDSAIKLLGTMEPDFSKWGEKLGGAITEGIAAAKTFFDNPGLAFSKFGPAFEDMLVNAVKSGLKRGFDESKEYLSDSLANFINWGNMSNTRFEGGQAKNTNRATSSPAQRRADAGLQDRMRAAGPSLVVKGNFTGPRAQSWLPQLRPLAEMQSASRLKGGGITSASFGTAGLTNFKSFQAARRDGVNVPFSSSLDKSAQRTTSLLGYRERRQMDMSRRAEIAARTGGREAGDTKIRRGDRKRMQDIQKANMREKQGVDKTNELLKKLETLFTQAWLTGGG